MKYIGTKSAWIVVFFPNKICLTVVSGAFVLKMVLFYSFFCFCLVILWKICKLAPLLKIMYFMLF